MGSFQSLMKSYINYNFISASIVLYQNKEQDLIKLFNCFLNSSINVKIFVIDNSPTNRLRKCINEYKDIDYFLNPSNPGFGASHNFAIKMAIEMGFKYHFIVNPDIFFECHAIEAMVLEMKNNNQIGMLMPKILNYDESIQYLPKLLPSPLSLLLRKIKFPGKKYKNYIEKYELRDFSDKTILNAPVLSGCFNVLNLNAIKHVGMYDDKYFMYFEDWDLSRRIHKYYKTQYFPIVSVFHAYDSGANKSLKLFVIFIKSAFYYFSKWGWFFDKDRKKINLAALNQFK